MVKVLVFGTGAVGSVYGYILHKAGASVTSVCRSNFDAVKANGITIRSNSWGTAHYRPNAVQSVTEAAHYGPFDYLLVCAKAFPGVAEQIMHAVGPKTVIVLAQNGIEIEPEYSYLYPDNTLVSGVVWLPTTQISPGVIQMGSGERFEIGTYPSSASRMDKLRTEQLSELWTYGGGYVLLFDDIQPLRWSKLAINCAFNPMCALSRCDGANLLNSSEDADDMVVMILRQVSTIAFAEGHRNLTEEAIQASVAWHRAKKETGGKEPSMLVDANHGKPIEVEAILGNTVRIARKHGIEVPYLELLYTLGRALNFSILKPEGWKQLDQSS
ncbi:hypothetical protein PV10_08648 [Lecanosticta acicola]|uniref:2-dehydropantoate 2-reductase n=1 Tax=Lecanosticta acicola TaxID=111012 RepID=A0AAI8YVT5_9PEZI|nr:hypothetical protein PV10_08648 [Lecanosticta acicola]